jgi:2,3-bisphosphoglycerate-dependent phosphoglycerate mutase
MQCKFEGKFWARLPQGESRFDVAKRIHQAFGTFHRDAEYHGIRDIVVICHGVTLRAFVMMWCHLPPEWFEAERNANNCAIRFIDSGVDKGYLFDGFPKRR